MISPSLYAMVIARLGSKRVKDKAIRYLGDKLLVEYPLMQLVNFMPAEQIFLNSPDAIFEGVAKKYNVAFYRRDEGMRDGTQDDLTYDFFVKHPQCEYLLQFNLTSPFITSEDLVGFLDYWAGSRVDALYSVKREQIEAIYGGEPVNFEFNGHMQQSQDLQPVFTFTSGLMFWSRAAFMRNYETNGGHALFCGTIGYYELNGISTIDIDWEEDFWLAEAILEKQQQGETDLLYHTDPVEFNREDILTKDGVDRVENYKIPFRFRNNINDICDGYTSDVSWSVDLANTPSYAMALITQLKDESNREHMHPNAEETWIIISGEAEVTIGDTVYHANPFDVYRIPKGVWHSIKVVTDRCVRLSVNREREAHVYRS